MLSTSRWASEPSAAKEVEKTEEVEQTVVPPQPEAPQAQPEATPAEQPQLPSQPEYKDAYDGQDDYAQTRDAEDLFADDFEPMEQPVVEHPVVAEPPRAIPTGPRNSGRGRGGRGGRGGHEFARQTNQQGEESANAKDEAAEKDEDGSSQQTTAPRVEAVRGDRSGTGGVKKAKLTEEELTARMAAVKLNNAKREAAHARAEADEAAYQAREAQAQEKRRQERQNRQQLMGERERNRQRKLNALSGREWDATKDEDLGLEPKDRGSQYRRGAHGGIAPDATPTPATDELIEDDATESRQRGGGNQRGAAGRGRGGRGTRGGRGGRGGVAPASSTITAQKVPSDADFPALKSDKPAASSDNTAAAAAASTESTAEAKADTKAAPKTMATAARWAEEME